MENNLESSAVLEHKTTATTAMVLGIVGVILAWVPFVSLAGLVVSIIAVVKSRKNRKFAEANGFAECGQNNAAFVCGLIGIIAGGMTVLLSILALAALLLLAVNVGTVAGPAIGDLITDVAPSVEDALEHAVPQVGSVVFPLLASLL